MRRLLLSVLLCSLAACQSDLARWPGVCSVRAHMAARLQQSEDEWLRICADTRRRLGVWHSFQPAVNEHWSGPMRVGVRGPAGFSNGTRTVAVAGISKTAVGNCFRLR